ncbi:ABC transporter substrate-binding protein [Streptomyces sp. SID3343]|nr:ABC transporter substrate-binding protein [Streptomyces sp. SID3343]
MRPVTSTPFKARLLRRSGVFAGLVGLTLGATACGGDDASGGGASGSMTVLITQEARGIDPITTTVSSLTGGNQAAAVFDMLFWINPKTGKAEPQIADSATPSEGNAVWTVKLKPNVKFTDGTTLDAEALKFNYERHADPANKSVQFTAVKGMKFDVVDAQNLKVTLPAPNAHFDLVLAHNLAFIGSPTAIRADPKLFSQKPVGAGPFKLKTWVRDSQLTLERNNSYWSPGKPALKELVFKPVQDQKQRLASLSSGQAQLMTTAHFPSTEQAKKDGMTVTLDEKSGGFMTMFDTSRPPFDDPRARRAFALIMNPDDRNNKIQGSPSQSTKGLFQPASPFADPKAVYATNNRAEAQRLLDELNAEGKPLNFTYTTNSSPSARITAEYWLGQLDGMKNISMKTEFLEGAQYITKVMINNDFQASEFVITFDEPEPVLYNFVHSKGPENRTKWNNPVVDKALDDARNSDDPAVRKTAYQTVASEIVKDVPFFSYEKSFAAAVQGRNTKIEGLALFEDGLILFDRIALK